MALSVTTSHTTTVTGADEAGKEVNAGQWNGTAAHSSSISGFGTGVETALGVDVGTAGAPVTNGGALGAPSSGDLGNCTGLPIGGGGTGGTTAATARAALGALGSSDACFSVSKNADQTGIADATFTKVTWQTENYDVGGFFSSNGWTPPAGKVFICACIYMQGSTTPGDYCIAAIYKNGSAFTKGLFPTTGHSDGDAPAFCQDVANGTDVYEVYVYFDTSSGTGTAPANVANFFMGTMI